MPPKKHNPPNVVKLKLFDSVTSAQPIVAEAIDNVVRRKGVALNTMTKRERTGELRDEIVKLGYSAKSLQQLLKTKLLGKVGGLYSCDCARTCVKKLLR